MNSTIANENRLRFVWLGLLALNVGLVLFALPSFIRGDVDAYTNEHARSVVLPLSGIFICAAGVVRATKLRAVLMGMAFLSVAMSFLLAR